MKLLQALMLMLYTSIAMAQGVYTRAYTNDRNGANTFETILTEANVLNYGVVRQTTIPEIGDARGGEAWPLVYQDVMTLASMANVVRGVNYRDGTGIWQITLCQPVNGGNNIDMHLINDKWGVLSTPVIDLDTGKEYAVAWCSDDGSGRPQTARYHMFVFRVLDGTVLNNVVIQGTSNGQTYSSSMRKQRSSLLLTNVKGVKTVFWASGTVLETTNGAAGWVFAFDTYTNRVTFSLADSRGLGAGIWMAGQGLAADPAGSLYAITGNGSFDGTMSFGESVIKLAYQSPTAISQSWMKIVQWFSPWSDAGRVGQNPALSAPSIKLPADKLAGASQPTEMIKDDQMPVGGGAMIMKKGSVKVVNDIDAQGAPVQRVYPVVGNRQAWQDEDFGSGGGVYIDEFKMYLAAGKDGIAYPVNTNKMGNTQPIDFLNAKANCDKLLAPPVWFTYSPGNVDPCPMDPTVLDFMPWGKTRHVHMTPVVARVNGNVYAFVWGENSPLQMWQVRQNSLTYIARSNEIASAQSVNSPGGMPGGFCSLGADVLWCSIPYGDANANIVNGRLLAYSLAPVNGMLRVLWDSQAAGLSYVFNKFMPPLVYNGRVYLPNYNGGVDVYRLQIQDQNAYSRLYGKAA